ncbi:hypothetical protein ACKI1I_32375 [Streptomyces turgidiscabies]|uniref:hypothetical protein n=1 Tax=Streptomyces TaxID=1883 RepID=UPI00338FF1BD
MACRAVVTHRMPEGTVFMYPHNGPASLPNPDAAPDPARVRPSLNRTSVSVKRTQPS